MPNIIKEIEQSLNEVPPLKIDIKPVVQTAPTPDPLSGVKPVALPEAVPQPVQAPQPSAPIQPITSTGSPVPEVPEVDALSYGDTISRMSAQSAADIQKTIQNAGTPKLNDVQSQLLGGNNPVQIDPKLSSQANPFAGNTPENAQERLAFEPPVLSNGLANPFSDPNARAAVAAGISREEYIAYIRDVKSKGEETTFGVPLQPNNLPLEVLQQQRLAASWQGLTAEQIRKKMAEKSGYLTARRNFNTSFLPLAGSENRNELETLFAALSFPANLVKGIGLDATRGIASVISGGFNIDQIKRDYEAMRPTRGGTFTGAAVLGEQFWSMSVIDQKGAPYNPLAVVRDDSNLFQAVLGFGLDVLADPLNNDKVAELLFKPVGLFQKTKLPAAVTQVENITQTIPQLSGTTTRYLSEGTDRPKLPPASSPLITRTIDVKAETIGLPQTVDRYGNQRVLVTPPNPVQSSDVLITPVKNAGDTPPVRPQPDRAPTPNTPPRSVVESPREIVIEREVAYTNELSTYQPSEVVFPEARQPYVPIPDSRAIVPVPEVNMYNNVTALFNDSPDLPVVQRFMRDVVEQKPFEQIPDASSLVVVQNPVLREVAEFAQTGDLTPNVAVLQGATVDEIADIVADRLELLDDTPLVVPKLVAQPIEVPQLEFDVTRQLPKQPSRVPDFNSDLIVSTNSISTPVNKNLDQSLVDTLAQEMVSAADTVRPVIVEKVSPVEFKVVSGELQYAAAVRAAELDPNFELRSVVVQKGTPQYEAIVKQEAAYKEIAKLSEDATLVSTARDTPTYTGTKTERVLGTTTGSRTLDLDAITTQRGGAYSTEAVQRMADSMLETGANVRPIVVRRTSPTEFELIRGNLEYLAAKRAAEMNPQFSEVRALVVDPKNEAAILRQLDILDEGIPVSSTMPVVVDDAPFTSLSDLIDDARDGGIESLSEVSKWVQKGDFVTKLKDIPAAVDDLGIDVLNTPSLMKVVKGRVGKLSNKTVKEVAESLLKVDMNKAEDISKSLFDALWRKSTGEQKQTILASIPPKRLNELGLERAETKVVPPTLPTLSHVQASIDYLGYGSALKPLSLEQQNLSDFMTEYARQNRSGVGLLDKMKNDAANELGIPIERVGTVLDELAAKGKVELNRTVKPYTYDLIPDRSVYESPYSAKDFEFTSSYFISNSSQTSIESLRVAVLREQGLSAREASLMKVHSISEEIGATGVISDASLDTLLKSRELSVASVAGRNWSSKMLKEVWEVATPQQKARIMSDIDAHTLEQLGLERIARSNVIDDHLPIETEFDIPC